VTRNKTGYKDGDKMALKAVGINKKFGGNTVIQNFSHEFTDGSFTCIMGASGCGKTTLMNMLLGVLSPDSGTVTGNDVRMSAVFQENRLCENLSVLSNLRLVMHGKPDRAIIETELEAVGLSGIADKPVRELSGGMKRRTALLRALLAEYEILFLDEPFKGLDDATKQTVMEYCKQKTAGRTVILITHDKSEAAFFGGETIILE